MQLFLFYVCLVGFLYVSVTIAGGGWVHFLGWPSARGVWSALGWLVGGECRQCWRLAEWAFPWTFTSTERYIHGLWISKVLEQKKKKRWNGTILFVFWIEEVIHKTFKILPASFVTTLLETFSSVFFKRGKCSVPMKACEIGTEVSWLPLLCIQKGVMYEGYMHKPEVITAIEKDLLNSTFLLQLCL